MKQLKDINLRDAYMNPADVRFYCTQWNPNGTSTLIIVDQDSQIIGSLDEFLFGPPLYTNDALNGVWFSPYGEAVMYLPEQDAQDISDDELLGQLDIDMVLSSIAVSPVHTKLSQLKLLVSMIKKAA